MDGHFAEAFDLYWGLVTIVNVDGFVDGRVEWAVISAAERGRCVASCFFEWMWALFKAYDSGFVQGRPIALSQKTASLLALFHPADVLSVQIFQPEKVLLCLVLLLSRSGAATGHLSLNVVCALWGYL